MPGVSLKPSDFQAGGGLLDDVDIVIKKCRFRLWDYNGTIQNPVLGLSVVMALLDGTGEAEQVYSAGETKNLVPSPDGREAVPVSPDRTGLPDGSNAALFLVSLLKSGFPEHLIGADVSVFDGLQCHVNRVPQPKRPGLTATNPDKKNDVLIVTKLYNPPGAVATAPAAATATAKPKKAAAPAPVAAEQAPAGDLDDLAVNAVMEVLLEKGGTIPKAGIAAAVFGLLGTKKDPNRNAISQLVFKDEFLGAAGRPWKFDGTTLTLGS